MMQGVYKLGLVGNEARLSACECSLNLAQTQVFAEVRLISGALRRDVMAAKRAWTLSWEYLPDLKVHTWDKGLGRNELAALFAATVGQPTWALSFHIPRQDNTEEDVSVQFEPASWKEQLLVRDGTLGNVYRVQFQVVEV